MGPRVRVKEGDRGVEKEREREKNGSHILLLRAPRDIGTNSPLVTGSQLPAFFYHAGETNCRLLSRAVSYPRAQTNILRKLGELCDTSRRPLQETAEERAAQETVARRAQMRLSHQ